MEKIVISESVVMDSLKLSQKQLIEALSEEELDTVYIDRIVEDIGLTVKDLLRVKREKKNGKRNY